MIVVLGRPRVYRPEPDGELAPGGLAVELALAAARKGAEVELVGAVGDDPEGDRIVIELGRAAVGHAALMRDPATRTPLVGQPRDARPLPRLDAADVPEVWRTDRRGSLCIEIRRDGAWRIDSRSVWNAPVAADPAARHGD